MTTKTKIFFFIIVGMAAIAVVALLSLEKLQVYTLPTRGGVSTDITVATAPQIEAWVRAAATEFNQRNSQISVQVILVKGIDATQSLDLGRQDSLPDAWIAEADFVRQMARSVPYDAQGPSLAHDSLVWLAVAGRNKLSGTPGWQAVHEAAVNNPQFRAALPSPANSIDGVAAYFSAAASYYQQPQLSSDMVANSDFLRWVDDILVAVPEKKQSPLNQLSRPPVSVDVGMVLQSEVSQLNANQFIQQVPQYNVALNFPYLVRRENAAQDAADRAKAAELFKTFLLSADQQNRLPSYGLQPAATPFTGQMVVADGATADRLRGQFK